MLDETYREAMGRMGPSAAQIEGLWGRLEGATRKRPRHTLRTVLVAAAVCVALCATALALSPGFREIIAGLLGEFAPLSQTVEGASATDEGIRVKVVAAIADEKSGTAYLEVRDLSGDRLSSNLLLNDTYYCKSYDAETKTALVEVNLDYYLSIANERGQKSLTLDFNRINSGERISFDTALPLDKIAGTAESRAATEAELEGKAGPRRVLLPGQTSMELDSDIFSLSSMGFDKEGKFHVLLQLAPGQEVMEGSRFGLSTWEEGSEVGVGHNGRGFVVYTQDGRTYVDMMAGDFVQLDVARLRSAAVLGELYTVPTIHGDWRLTFPLQTLPERVIELSDSVGQEQLALEKIELSAMTLRLSGRTFDGRATSPFFKMPVTLHLADGETLALSEPNAGGIWTWQDMGTDVILADGDKYEEDVKNGIGYFEHDWQYGAPINPAEVTGISIGEYFISLDGE